MGIFCKNVAMTFYKQKIDTKKDLKKARNIFYLLKTKILFIVHGWASAADYRCVLDQLHEQNLAKRTIKKVCFGMSCNQK